MLQNLADFSFFEPIRFLLQQTVGSLKLLNINRMPANYWCKNFDNKVLMYCQLIKLKSLISHKNYCVKFYSEKFSKKLYTFKVLQRTDMYFSKNPTILVQRRQTCSARCNVTGSLRKNHNILSWTSTRKDLESSAAGRWLNLSENVHPIYAKDWVNVSHI